MFNMLKQFRKVFGPSVTAAPPRWKSHPTFKPRLEALEERWCPATTDTLALTHPASPDFGIDGNTLIWNPVAGSQDASQVTNWYDYTQGFQLTSGYKISATNPIVLDGSKSNTPIEFTSAMTVFSFTVQNGYQNTMTIDATLTTMQNDVVKGSNTLTLVSKDSTGILLNNDNNFTVQAGGTLKLTDAPQATQGAAFLTAATENSGEYLKNQGTVTWNGTAVASGKGALADTLAAPVLNTGTFTVDGGTNGNNSAVGAILDVIGYDSVNTYSASFDQSQGSLNIQNGAEIALWNNYYQTGGSLTSDSSANCVVQAGDLGQGGIDIAGGQVTVDTVANSVATLTFNADTVDFNGQLNVSGLTQGNNSTKSDQLYCKGAAVTLGTNSILNVGTTGTDPLGTGNRWTVMQYASIKNSWSSPPTVPPTMSASTGATDVLISN